MMEQLLVDLKTRQLTDTASFRLQFFFVIGLCQVSHIHIKSLTL
jgi:hypothetical protein